MAEQVTVTENHHHYHNDESTIVRLAEEVFERNYLSLLGDAQDLAIALARAFAAKFGHALFEEIERTGIDLSAIGTPRMMAAIYAAQRSYVETGDESLADTLIGVLVEMTTEEPRSLKDAILTRALEALPKLTDAHSCALAVIVLMTRSEFTSVQDPESLLRELDKALRPFYGLVPTKAIEYSYMASCGVGGVNVGMDPFELLRRTYPHIFQKPFAKTDLPEEITSISGFEQDLLEAVRPFESGAESTMYIFTRRAVEEILTDEKNSDFMSRQPRTDFFLNLRLKSDGVSDLCGHYQPDLLGFLKLLEKTNAVQFQLTAVGLAIGLTKWRSFDPSAFTLEGMLEMGD